MKLCDFLLGASHVLGLWFLGALFGTVDPHEIAVHPATFGRALLVTCALGGMALALYRRIYVYPYVTPRTQRDPRSDTASHRVRPD